jgi:hypothetical protein
MAESGRREAMLAAFGDSLGFRWFLVTMFVAVLGVLGRELAI